MKCVALIPIYKAALNSAEERNVLQSLENLKGQNCVPLWLAPKSIDRGYYQALAPGLQFSFHDPAWFSSVSSYSRLLLSDVFYHEYSCFEFLLILQTDAVILKPSLNHWLDKPYDYIGAPWLRGWEMELPIRCGSKLESWPCRAFIGNGGLSLRRTSKILELLNGFPEAREMWLKIGHPEDLLIAMLASISDSMVIPTIGTAARFSIETDSDRLFRLIQGDTPFGLHGPIVSQLSSFGIQAEPSVNTLLS